MVPAVTDISYRQLSQRRRFRRIDKASDPEHRGHTHPPGQRRADRYPAQASSVLNRVSNSSKVFGKSSSMTQNTTSWGRWRQVHIPIADCRLKNSPFSILKIHINSFLFDSLAR